MNNGEDSASRTDLNHENQSSDVNYGEQTILSGGTGGSSGGSGTDREDEDKLLDNQVGNLMQDLFKILLGGGACVATNGNFSIILTPNCQFFCFVVMNCVG